MNAKRFLLGIVLILSGAPHVFAHVSTQAIHVLSFKPAKHADRFTLVFEAVTADYGEITNLPQKKRRFEVRLRCEPRFCSLETYREGIRILRDRIARGRDITIGRMSDCGWRPIPGQRKIFESIGLGIHYSSNDRTGDDDALIYFIHDERY